MYARLLPSSLDSLANGWRAFCDGEVLGSYAGILAPPHDGDFPGFTGYARAAFDEAEPMGVQIQKRRNHPVRVRGNSRIQSMRVIRTNERLKSFAVIFDVCVYKSRHSERKREKVKKSGRRLIQNSSNIFKECREKCEQIDDSGI